MFSYRRTAHYHETDQMGVIHHSNYVKWMEEARIAFMAEIGLSYEQMERDGVVSPVASLSVEYKRPLHFADTVEVRIRVRRYTGAVLELLYEFVNVSTGETAALAASRHGFLRGGRPVSLKREMPELDGAIRALEEPEKAGAGAEA